MKCRGSWIAVVALAALVSVPARALAQSTVTGLVKDASGGVLPGVTVEAKSDALIERTRSVTTDDQGRYSIVELRPGTYSVTFALSGFATLVRDDINLPSNFTATIDADLKVGELAETVTVSGQSPVIDVHTAQRTVVMRRDLLDSVPTSRNYAPIAALTVGVKVNDQNVGGARTAVQQRLTVHGSVSKDTTVEVDGMKMNSMLGDGDSQGQHNDAMTQEVVVQTSGAGADVSAGGVHVNLIPREGGNRVSGSSYVGYSGHTFQSDNLSAALQQRGLRRGNEVDYVADVNTQLGGPIQKDKLWFLGSFRAQNNANIVANTFYADGSPAIYDASVYNFTLRLTSQVTPRNKVTAYLDRALMADDELYGSAGVQPSAASRRTPVLFYTGALKWTSPVTSKLLVTAGLGAHAIGFNGLGQPGVGKLRGTPEWIASASRNDIVLATTTTAPATFNHDYPMMYTVESSGSYVTGSHTFKTGVQWRFGSHHLSRDANGDLNERFRSGVPDSVMVYNTPTTSSVRLNADLGLYAQDSWTLKRLTVTPGLRWEYFNSSIEASNEARGRFIGPRSFPEVSDIPNWTSFAPRFGAVYNLTGDAKTAVKASINKYNRQFTSGFGLLYDPSTLQNDVRNWSDCDYVPGTSRCSGVVLPTNGDGVAQNNEIGPSNNSRFGEGAARRSDPNIKREYDVQYSIGVDRELLTGMSVGAAWYRRVTRNRPKQVNLLIDTAADYTAFQTSNPLNNGESVTIYNLNSGKQGLLDLVDTTSDNAGKNRQTYNGFDLSVTARLPHSGNMFGGMSADRPVTVTCEGFDPNTFRYCDQSVLDIPFRYDFKFAGSYPVPFDVQVGATLASYAGAPLTVNWAVPANVFPGGQRTQAVTVALIPPGAKYLARWNQLDVSVRRVFKLKRMRFDGAIEIFNVLNGNVVLSENQNFGATLGQPQSILQPRLLRVSTQTRF